MDSEIEEGLCELAAYLYLLSSLKEPSDDAVVQCDEAALRHQSRTGRMQTCTQLCCAVRRDCSAGQRTPKLGPRLRLKELTPPA